MLNVTFDAHFLLSAYSGHGRYTRALVHTMQAMAAGADCRIIPYGPPLPSVVAKEGVLAEYLVIPTRRAHPIFWAGRHSIKRFDAQVHYSQYTAPVGAEVKRYVTIHDTAFALPWLAEYCPLKTLAFKYFAAKADTIITGRLRREWILKKCCPPCVPQFR